MLTEEERKSRVWRKVCAAIDEYSEDNRRKNEAHLDIIETTKLRSRNEALSWLKDQLSPEPIEISEPPKDFGFDED